MRYDLYRATAQGTWKTSLPLAANDPPGTWKVVVRELLGNSEDAAAFTLGGVAQCGTLQVLGAGGEVRTLQLLPQDIAGLAWLDGKLVVGLANGRVVALTIP